jgi:hypothetical protein
MAYQRNLLGFASRCNGRGLLLESVAVAGEAAEEAQG